MAQTVDAFGYINPIIAVTVGQCCAAWSWSYGAMSLARLVIMRMMMNHPWTGQLPGKGILV